MISASGVCLGLAVLLLVDFSGTYAGRIARSPQFSQAQANAQAGGGFGGGGSHHRFGPPNIGPGFRQGHGGPGLGGGPGTFYGPGRRGYGGPGFNSGFGGLGSNGGTISISKSISISRGNGGVAQSSAGSTAAGK